MKSTVKKTMKTKSGIVIEFGEVVEVQKHKDFDNILTVNTEDGRTISTRAYIAHTKLTGFKQPPSERTLEKWVADSVVSSITGQRVEPDGYDKYGFPSWLLVIGLI